MGAIQDQDYNMAKWALGVRLPNSTDKQIETAINNGEILRTYLTGFLNTSLILSNSRRYIIPIPCV